MLIRSSQSGQGLGLGASARRYAMRETVHLLRPADGDRDPAGPMPCLGIVGHIDDGETAEVLLGLDEGAVGEYGRAAARVDAAHDRRRVQTAVAEDEDTGGRHLLDQGSGGRAPLAQLLHREVGHPLVVEGDQVQRHVELLCSRAAWTAATHLLHERTRVDTTLRPGLFPSLPHPSRSNPSGTSAPSAPGSQLSARARTSGAYSAWQFYRPIRVTMMSLIRSGSSAQVASPMESSTRWMPGSMVVMAVGQAQILCSAARWRAAAANLSCVVSSRRCIIGTCGGLGTTRTPLTSPRAAAMARAWLR